MSPSSPPVLASRRQRRPPGLSRGRKRPPKRVAISTVVKMAIRSRMPAIRSALVVTAVWSVAACAYFAFRNDVLTRLGRQTDMQIIYEDHIAELRVHVDRVLSRQLLDQMRIEQQLNALLQREKTLEQRTSALTNVHSDGRGTTGRGHAYFGTLNAGHQRTFVVCATSKGKTHCTAARASTGGTIVGTASMYDPFHPGYKEGGVETASGELYEPGAWTAAIQTDLREMFGGIGYGKDYRPVYALIEAAGKRAIVKINDVGPLEPGRVIDFNEKTMRYFDPSLERGIIRNVRITPLPGDDWTPGPIPPITRLAMGER